VRSTGDFPRCEESHSQSVRGSRLRGERGLALHSSRTKPPQPPIPAPLPHAGPSVVSPSLGPARSPTPSGLAGNFGATAPRGERVLERAVYAAQVRCFFFTVYIPYTYIEPAVVLYPLSLKETGRPFIYTTEPSAPPKKQHYNHDTR
jgi:hypothetical protein